MVESVLLSALLPLVLEKTGSLMEHQLVKLWSSRDLKRELWKLQHVLSTIQSVLEDAEMKQQRDESLRLWLAHLKDAAYDAEDLLDDIDLRLIRQQRLREDRSPIAVMGLKVHDFFSCSHNPLLFHAKMSQRAKEINERIDELAKVRSKFNLRTNDNSPPQAMDYTRPLTHSYVPESEVIGREADAARIIELLIEQESRKDVSVLPIVGMGGLGKTTLLQMIYNHQRVKDHFELQMWVSVPDDFSIGKIIKTMIENATSSKCELSDLDSLQRKLSQVIDRKRYLLALDDVWNEDHQKWEDLRVLLTFGGRGSTVVVTTRSGNVSSLVGTLDAYMLTGLSDDECWTLFTSKAFVSGAEEYSSLVEIGRLIVNKCGGLPLAVKALGSLMPQFKNDETKWKSVMESELWDLSVGQNRILPALSLSYHHLPPHLKQCFAFCAIFPRGYNIDEERLIELWMANGFIQSNDKGFKLEFGGQSAFNDLEQRCFFQIINYEIRMHDLIHDLAKSIIGHECYILNKWEDISPRKFRHVIMDPIHKLHDSTDLLSSSDSKRTPSRASKTMRTLLYNSFNARPRFNYPRINHLRALCISQHNVCYGNSCISEFPISICNFRHLRYLELSMNNSFKTLPEDISMLFNLQTLRLINCMKLRRLPKSIRRMSSLMHLYLDGCDSLECMPSGMGELKRLRKITRYTVGSEVGSGRITDLKHWNIHGNLVLDRLENVESAFDAEEVSLCSKENLRDLTLQWSLKLTRRIVDEKVLQALRPHQNLEKLTMNGYSGAKLPTWLMEDSMFLKNLVLVSITGLTRCEHLPKLEHLPSLESLRLGMGSVKYMGGSEFYGTASSVVFPSLRSIELRGMSSLEEWSGVEGRPSFPNISKVVIIGCPKLKTMPSFPSAHSLRIKDCPLLSAAKDSFSWMRSLRELSMVGECEKLIMMLEQEEELTLDSLLRLVIIDGLSWQLRPWSQLWNCFPFLQQLEIYSCSGLEGFHPEGLLRLTALRKLTLGRNDELVALPELPESIRCVHISYCIHLISLPEGMGRLPALEELDLGFLPMLSQLPEEVEGYRSLKILVIQRCHGLVSFPVGLRRRIPNLRYLDIRDCPELKKPCEAGGRVLGPRLNLSS